MNKMEPNGMKSSNRLPKSCKQPKIKKKSGFLQGPIAPSFFPENWSQATTLSFNDALFPKDCSNEEYEDIYSRMVSIEVERTCFIQLSSIFCHFMNLGYILKKKLLLSSLKKPVLKIVFWEIDSVFALLRDEDFKRYKYHAHVMDLDPQDDIEVGEEDENCNYVSEEDFSKFEKLNKSSKIEEVIVVEVKHTRSNLRFNLPRRVEGSLQSD